MGSFFPTLIRLCFLNSIGSISFPGLYPLYDSQGKEYLGAAVCFMAPAEGRLVYTVFGSYFMAEAAKQPELPPALSAMVCPWSISSVIAYRFLWRFNSFPSFVTAVFKYSFIAWRVLVSTKHSSLYRSVQAFHSLQGTWLLQGFYNNILLVPKPPPI